VPWLLRALQDADAEVRTEAAQRLAYWEQDATVQALIRALQDDPVQAVREAVAHSLAELKLLSAGPWLLPATSHADAFVRASALRALRELRLPESYLPALQGLDDQDARVRLEAVGVLGWLKRDDALSGLAWAAQHDGEPDVRRAAVGSLGYACDERVLPALLAAMADEVWQVREEAATTLGKLKLAGAVDALLTALEDAYWQVRQRAVRALGQLRQPKAVPAVASLLSHAIVNLRKEAVIALGEIRDPSALGALEGAMSDPDPEVRKVARLAVSQIKA
jgi:HEAT repeat protein